MSNDNPYNVDYIVGRVMYGDDQTDDARITVEVEEGWITFTGRLDDDPDKIVQIAVPITGIRDVLREGTLQAIAAELEQLPGDEER